MAGFGGTHAGTNLRSSNASVVTGGSGLVMHQVCTGVQPVWTSRAAGHAGGKNKHMTKHPKPFGSSPRQPITASHGGDGSTKAGFSHGEPRRTMESHGGASRRRG